METTEMGVLLWESREREVAPKYTPNECLTGRTHLPPRYVPSTVWPGPVPGASLGLFYSRVDLHSHFIEEEAETRGKWLTQSRQPVIGERGLSAPSSRWSSRAVGFRWWPLSSVAPLSHHKARGLRAWHRAGLVSSSEMPSRHSPLGHLIHYASGG